MKTIIVYTEAGFPPGHMTEPVLNSDLVLLKNLAGLWTVWKDPYRCTLRRVPWDDLPERIKAEVPNYQAP